MSFIFGFNKNIRLFLFLIAIFIIKAKEERELTKRKLFSYSLIKTYWNLNKSYIYYIDIQRYI